MPQLFKNTASQKLRVFAFADSGHATLDSGEPVTGDAANISAQTALDNAALGASNDVAPTEVDAANAPGYYEFDPTQGETNGDVIEWYPKSSTAGVQVVTVGGNVQTLQPPNLPNLGIESDGDLTKVNTLNGHTAQTGDSYAIVNSGTHGNSALKTLIDTVDTVVDAVKAVTDLHPNSGAFNDLATLAARLTAARAGYLDNLNVGGNVASSAEVTAIQNTTRSKAVQPSFIERPDSGSLTPELFLFLYDTDGSMEAPDSTPTIAITNSEGTDRSANLSAVSNPGTGRYQTTYTVADDHAIEHLQGTWSYVEGGNTIVVPFAFTVVDTTAVDFTSADRTKLDTLHDARLTAARAANLDELGSANIPADVDTLLSRLTAARAGYMDNLNGHTPQTGDSFVRLGVPAGASLSADIAAVNALIAALNDISTSDLLAMVYEGSEDFQDFLRLARAALWGILAGAATSTVTMRDAANTKNRISATVDADGNRSAVTVDAS